VLVGVISGTVVRHVIQAVPIAFALALLALRPASGANAALPIFAFWTGISFLIWLFLLGISEFARGRYSTGEVILTCCMAALSVAGILASLPQGRGIGAARRALVWSGFAFLQVAAMWVSFQPAIASR